jgi:hypothetical protein
LACEEASEEVLVAAGALVIQQWPMMNYSLGDRFLAPEEAEAVGDSEEDLLAHLIGNT